MEACGGDVALVRCVQQEVVAMVSDQQRIDKHLAAVFDAHYPATRDWLRAIGYAITLRDVTRAMAAQADNAGGDRRMAVLAWAVGEATQLARDETPPPYRPQE